MGTGASVPNNVEDAIKAGYSQGEIDAYLEKQLTAAKPRPVTCRHKHTMETESFEIAASLAQPMRKSSIIEEGVNFFATDRTSPFWDRVRTLFQYMEKSIDDRDDKGYITTADLVAFFGEGSESFKEEGAEKNSTYWLGEIDAYGDNSGYITLQELYAYFDYLQTSEGGEEAAEKALQSMEAYEGYAQHLVELPSRSPPFAKRVKNLFAYIDKSIPGRDNVPDGFITTEDLLAFFGETGNEADGDSNASYWLQQMDGYGENQGYITLQEMSSYFDSLGSLEEAVRALESLEAYEGYSAAEVDDSAPATAATAADAADAAADTVATAASNAGGGDYIDEATAVDRETPFWKRVKSLFLYMEGAIHARDDKGYISTEDLVAFFGDSTASHDGAQTSTYWLEQIDGYGDNSGYITLDELYQYFDYLLSCDNGIEKAEQAILSLEAYEGYSAATEVQEEEIQVDQDGNRCMDI